MDFQIENIIFTIPAHRDVVSLRQRIDYDVKFGDDLNFAIEEIEKSKDLADEDKVKKLHEIYIDRAQKTLAFFATLELDDVQQIPIGEVIKIYENHLKSLIELKIEPSEANSIMVGSNLYWIPEPTLSPSNDFLFNEFITAKEVSRNMSETASQKLTSIAYLGVIFFRKFNDKFDDSDLSEGENKLDFILDLPISTALRIGKFYDDWSTFIGENFSVFKKSKLKGGIDMSAHFDKWGWLAFLNYVAKNGMIFYRANGLTNLENVKQASTYEVLTWASCEHDAEEIIGKAMEEMDRKQKRK